MHRNVPLLIFFIHSAIIIEKETPVRNPYMYSINIFAKSTQTILLTGDGGRSREMEAQSISLAPKLEPELGLELEMACRWHLVQQEARK